ncbi:transcriptional regulator, TetR family [Deinococcus aerius]|uniref:Transcriptional regulator, TetR family n=1 Tax=Deinococcus aerius TaxID=200253 RepID=A0A2I9DZ98_9DEIO|nr:TetR/AcrR family transcriptional regulator [Deinococcus aerius]GBF06305.1 transcriptional regulator, TetR family [Deinococcus aerius]
MSSVKAEPQLTHRQRQALATQGLIVDAARALFLQRGYAATTIDDIARGAGVAVSTVYSVFGNKRGIFRAIREAWHQTSRQRDLTQEALMQEEPARRLELMAHLTRRQWETGAEMVQIYQSAAKSDPEANAELQRALAGRRSGQRHFIEKSAHMLRPGLGVERASAVLQALTLFEVYRELVGEAGWTPDEYEVWLARTLQQQLLPQPSDAAAARPGRGRTRTPPSR